MKKRKAHKVSSGQGVAVAAQKVYVAKRAREEGATVSPGRSFYLGLLLGLHAPGMVFKRRRYHVSRYRSSVGKAWSDVGTLLGDAVTAEGEAIGQEALTAAAEATRIDSKASVP